jgi:hypothetical protein
MWVAPTPIQHRPIRRSAGGGLIVVLWRAALGLQEALALTERSFRRSGQFDPVLVKRLRQLVQFVDVDNPPRTGLPAR